MTRVIKIGNKEVGEGKQTFVIAEAGINHNGKLRIAKKLVDAAVEAGADAVKFQTYNTEALVSKDAPLVSYQKHGKRRYLTQYEMLKQFELKREDFYELYDYCSKKNIVFLSTPHDEESLDFLVQLGVKAIKIASGDITNIPFLQRAAKTNLPLLISTGMSTMPEIANAVKVVKMYSKTPFALLHCVSSYPADIRDLNLRAISSMYKKFNTIIGYSDHTTFSIAPIVAVVFGACIIEKHLTVDKNMEGPDHKMSLEPEELKLTINWIREAERSLGSHKKIVTQNEYESRNLARKSIVASVDIPKGTKISRQMLAIKRPGTGIAPAFLQKIIGKYAVMNIPADGVIEWKMISNKPSD